MIPRISRQKNTSSSSWLLVSFDGALFTGAFIKFIVLPVLLISHVFPNNSLAVRTSQKIYDDIQANLFCLRRLNATHQIGCSSKRNGNVGVVHYVNSTQDIDWVIKSGPDAPYVAALPIPFFTTVNMHALKNSGRVAGVLVLKGNTTTLPEDGFSPDLSCPNQNTGFYTKALNPEYAMCQKQQWNPDNPVLGMMYEDWSLPVFLITSEDSINKIIVECYQQFNQPETRSWPLCAAQLLNVMLAVGNSVICMRRTELIMTRPIPDPSQLCLPLRSRNIVATLFPTNKSVGIKDKSLIILATHIDASSQFEGLAPGVDSAITGLITFLTIAKTLSGFKDELRSSAKEKNVLFLIFSGVSSASTLFESFDYIGSSRVVFDMEEQSAFPVKEDDDEKLQPAQIRLRHIDVFLELSQLAPHQPFSGIVMHSDPVTMRDFNVANKVSKMKNIIMNETVSLGMVDSFRPSPSDVPLPPSSFQSFLRTGHAIPGLVITNHEREFKNRYYNSIFDTIENLDTSALDVATHLANISLVLSRSIFYMLTESSAPTDMSKPDVKLVSELLECYLKNTSCSLFSKVSYRKTMDISEYKSVPLNLHSTDGSVNLVTFFSHLLLAFFTGNMVDKHTKEDCLDEENQIFHYNWMEGDKDSSTGMCVQSTVRFTPALSPAFVLEDWNSRIYSTWTESVAPEASVRIFLLPSLSQQCATLVSGVIVLVLSHTVVYGISKHASTLFSIGREN